MFGTSLVRSRSRRRATTPVWFTVVVLASVSMTSCGTVTSASSSSARLLAACNRVMSTRSTKVPLPRVLRLSSPFTFNDAHFKPVAVGYVPKAPARSIWVTKGGTLIRETGASYKIYLARYFTPPGRPQMGGIADQNVWLLIGRHLAFVPDIGPMAPPKGTQRPTCVFASGIAFGNADSGQELEVTG